MKQADGKVAEAYDLGQRFAYMIHENQSEALLPWLEDATKDSMEALKQFAKTHKAGHSSGYQCSFITVE